MSSNKKKKKPDPYSMDDHHLSFSYFPEHTHAHTYFTASAAVESHRLSSYSPPGQGLALVA